MIVVAPLMLSANNNILAHREERQADNMPMVCIGDRHDLPSLWLCGSEYIHQQEAFFVITRSVNDLRKNKESKSNMFQSLYNSLYQPLPRKNK